MSFRWPNLFKRIGYSYINDRKALIKLREEAKIIYTYKQFYLKN